MYNKPADWLESPTLFLALLISAHICLFYKAVGILLVYNLACHRVLVTLLSGHKSRGIRNLSFYHNAPTSFLVGENLLGLVVAAEVPLFHPQALNAAEHTDTRIGPPGKAYHSQIEALSIDQSGDSRAKRSTDACSAGSDTVDRAKDKKGWSGVGEKDRVAGVSKNGKDDPDKKDRAHSGHGKGRGEKINVWNYEVGYWV